MKIDLTGRTFGRLTVLAHAGRHKRRALWRCRCECGKERVVAAHYLLSGESRSCGCLHAERAARLGRAKRIDLAGYRFGRLIALEPLRERSASQDVRWRCRCDCGRSHVTTASRLRKGLTLSCGCLREELAAARAPTVGALKRIKACRTCGRIYEAVGPQKECSPTCRRRWHADDEARRREQSRRIKLLADAARLAAELQRRLDHGEEG